MDVKKQHCLALSIFFSAVLLLTFVGCRSFLDNLVRERVESPITTPDGKTTFYYVSDSARSVSVAGEFNGWEYRPEQPRAIIMKKNEKNIWQATANIPSGRYQYKIVIDYQTWVTDPYNTNTVDDGTGNINSLLIVR